MKGKAGPRPGPVVKKDKTKPKDDPKKKAKPAAAAKPAEPKNKPAAEPKAAKKNGGAKPGPGHNTQLGLTDDQEFALYSMARKKYAEALEAKQEAANNFLKVCRAFKAELGEHAVANIKLLIQLDSPTGEAAVKAKISRELKMARWSGLPVGTQGDIFEAVDRTPAVDKAHALGKRHALGGTGRPENPHSPPTPQYHAYIAGWSDGQAILAKGIKPLPPAEPPADDDFSSDLNLQGEQPPSPATH